jgi:ubiquinol-cytochrome c reductase cytochrome b/c1 subunit
MFERDGRPADHFPTPWPNENAARARYNGVPPDMSVLAKARSYERGFPWFIFDMFTQFQEHGVDYIHALMSGYKEKPPAGVALPQGTFYNDYFPGHAHRDAAAAVRQARRLHRRLADHGRSVSPRTSPRS